MILIVAGLYAFVSAILIDTYHDEFEEYRTAEIIKHIELQDCWNKFVEGKETRTSLKIRPYVTFAFDYVANEYKYAYNEVRR